MSSGLRMVLVIALAGFAFPFAATRLDGRCSQPPGTAAGSESNWQAWEARTSEAILLEEAGDFTGALRVFLKALSLAERAGKQSPEVAAALNNLALTYEHLGRYTDAERCLRRALLVWGNNFGDDSPQLAVPLNNLARLYLEHGAYAKAGRLPVEAMAARLQVAGLLDERLAMLSSTLAMIRVAEGRCADGERCARQSLDLYVKNFGENHPDSVEALHTLATIKAVAGNKDEALEALELSLRKFRAAAPGDCYTLLRMLSSAGQTLGVAGFLRPAEKMFAEALKLAEARYGPEHPLTGGILSKYAAVLRGLDRKKEARQMEVRAREILGQCDPFDMTIDRSEHPGR